MSYSEKAAVADLITIVKARFVEAADTTVHLDVRQIRPAPVRSLWPAMQAETNTVGGHSAGYGINGNHVPYRPSSAAISRAEEVLYRWQSDFITIDADRILIGKWSICLAAPRIAGSFRGYCEKNGVSRSTADRHVADAFERVARQILKNSQSLQGPNWSRVMPMMPNQRINPSKLAGVLHWLAADAKPSHRPDMLEPLSEARRKAA